MARKRLNFSDYSWDDFFLIGMVCPLFDYQLCWNLNKALGLQLRKQEDLTTVEQQKSSLGSFSFFRYFDELNKCSFFLISNRNNERLFLPEAGSLDFLFMIEGELNAEDRSGFLKKLKALPIIQMASAIDLKKVKQKERLIFE